LKEGQFLTEFPQYHVQVFQSRESAEYGSTLSELMSIKASPAAKYPDLRTTSYKLLPEEIKKLNRNDNGSKIKRVIEIEYIGMSGSVLLDKQKIYAPNSQYARLRELIESCKRTE
jgi:hypothetical protein